ncbi:MAG: polysaccharide deacetylase family protein [Thermodesulfovibrionales bacterium]
MKLIITIDTEEDTWGCYSPGGHTVRNIERIPGLQDVFDTFTVKPSYLVTYPVARNEKAVAILKEIMERGGCEIGMHCHPWNTPPFEEVSNEVNSMLCNLDDRLQFKKLKCLHSTIQRNFRTAPVSFRSGRWGYSQSVANNLYRLGYKIDTSVTPYTDWTRFFGPSFQTHSPSPFRVPCDGPTAGEGSGYLTEVPATIGYLQKNFTISNYLFRVLSGKQLRRLRLIGVMDRLNMLNKVWLSPEQSDTGDMIRLALRMKKNGYELINMFFHSPTLKAGLTEFVQNRKEERLFVRRIREFLEFARAEGIESICLSDSLRQLEEGSGACRPAAS